MKAKDLMTSNVLSATTQTPFKDLIRVFVEMNVNHVPIINSNGGLRAMMSSTDALRALHEMSHVTARFDGINIETGLNVKEEMSKGVISINIDASVSDAVSKMIEENIHSLPVTDNDEMVGILTSNDILKALYEGKISL